MASSSNYMFNNLSGLGDDKCYLSQTEIQNKSYEAYNFTKKKKKRIAFPIKDED